MKCRICLENADEEHPDTVWGVNPETFRRGVMHFWCFVSAYDALKGVDAKQPIKFVDRQDEYDQLAQNKPLVRIG